MLETAAIISAVLAGFAGLITAIIALIRQVTNSQLLVQKGAVDTLTVLVTGMQGRIDALLKTIAALEKEGEFLHRKSDELEDKLQSAQGRISDLERENAELRVMLKARGRFRPSSASPGNGKASH